ncbi:LytR family transcriptional attenuator [Nocardia pseudobrasiliensis]|uniref:LytR family transcriptional attenuator n=3 Tax=Nocardia pseudobrasiliensis TaxID=45979 RepID=A0A370HT12_9NOCA|nr:LytR family transcriptional attenuator [Nocardia pseudobrasiliensis]
MNRRVAGISSITVMNGDDPRQYPRTRRVPPPGGPGPHRPPHPQRPPGDETTRVEPTQVIRRGNTPGRPLAWSEAPQNRPAPPRPRPDAGRQAPPTHAPTQRPVPYREAPPPPPRRGDIPPRGPGGRPARGSGGRPPRPRRKRHWGRWLLLLVVILLVTPVAATIYLDRSLDRIPVLADYSGRVGKTAGTNWLLTGSDSRVGLTQDQERELSTGDQADAGGERSDTMMLVHIPKSGPTTIVSLPRDSYVQIPGVGRDKLNAAFSAGGPKLLVQTVETATGLHIDHFAKIGFGGFAGMVDALGGIDMCLPDPIDDPLAGINLPAGCQHLTGAQALGFVRTRATPRADLDRMNNQRLFLSALLKKAGSAGTLANPFRAWPLATGLVDSLQVDKGDHIWDLASLGWALHSDTVATTVPIGGFDDVSSSGNVLLWDKAKASRFFEALASDQPIPEDLLTR